MIRRHAATLRATLMLVDGLMAAGLLVGLSVVRFGPDWAAYWRAVIPDPLAFLLVFAIGWIALLALNGLYRPRARWTIRGEALDVAKATVAMALITLAVLFWFKSPDVSRAFLVVLFPLQAALTLATRAALRVAFRWLRSSGRNARFVLVVGAGPRAQAFATRIEEHRELGLKVVGFLDDDQAFDLPNGWQYLGSLGDLESVLHSNVIDEVAVCLPFSQWDLVDALTQICEDEGKIVRVPIDVLDRAFASGKVDELDGIPVYSVVSGPDRMVGLAIKRAIDLVGSLLLLVLLSPLLAAVAAWVRYSDGGAIFFRQVRTGLHGRPFTVIKFRTMAPDAEERYADLVAQSDSRAFKLTNDPRITPAGRFLRRTSIDELPQLWNVLRGEMSLVGPRPAPPREVEGYDIWHRRRLSMKPGITGLWQVTARSIDDFDNRAQLDLTYIDRWSLWLDLQILVRTIPAALEGR